ncbi:MAG: M28 family peptidase [Vicinamibacterales bacterium]
MILKPRRLIGLSIVAAGLVWMTIAGYLEARRIDSQRGSRPVTTAQPAAMRIDSERLMSTVQTLSEPRFEGRRTDSPGGIAARAWILERMKAAGLLSVSGAYLFPFRFTYLSIKGIVDPERSFRTEYTDAANVVGQCLGADTKAPVILITAHYDHVGVRGGVLYPGADDNASGIAVLLEIADYCRRSPFRRTILFVAFDAEELGLQGSQSLLIAPPIPNDRMALDVNLDMVSRSDRRELFAAGTYQHPELKPVLEEVAKRAPVALLFGHDKPLTVAGGVQDWTSQSDHGSFQKAGIPFIYFGVEDHADYHRPTDTADKINRGFFVDAAETILDAVIALDRSLSLGPLNRAPPLIDVEPLIRR